MCKNPVKNRYAFEIFNVDNCLFCLSIIREGIYLHRTLLIGKFPIFFLLSLLIEISFQLTGALWFIGGIGLGISG